MRRMLEITSAIGHKHLTSNECIEIFNQNPRTRYPLPRNSVSVDTTQSRSFLGRSVERLRDSLADPRLKGVSIDDPLIIQKHREILREKRAMQQVFREFYDLCYGLDERYFHGAGHRVEIGAGSSFFKQVYPSITSTDIKPVEHLDMVVDALDMPFEDGSVRAFYCVNCFHHFPDPRKFFSELERTLYPGAGCVLIEPYFGLVASWFYRHLFDVEHFNKSQPAWDETQEDEFVGANQALSYVVFFRDRETFDREFPGLEIVSTRTLDNYMRYLLSGGLNFRQLVPDFALGAVRLLEKCFFLFHGQLALHHAILIRKKSEPTIDS